MSETKTKQVEMKANKNSKKKTSDGIAKSSKPKAEKPQPKIIEELTPEQLAKCPEYVEKWVAIGTNTEEIDPLKAIDAIKKCYKSAGLTPPKYFIGPVNNPYEAAIVEALLQQHSEIEEDEENGVEAKEGTYFKSGKAMVAQVMAEMLEIVASDKASHPKIDISNQIYGFQEYWLSYYDFFQTECGLDLGKLNPLIELSKNCGWWTPLKDVAIFQHRPLEIHRKGDRLHNTEGAAIKYRGSEFCNVYSVDGVVVSKKVIDRDFTAKDIDAEQNVEIRRVMIDLFGQENYIQGTDAQIVHQDDFGTLYLKKQKNDEDILMVKVVNSTAEKDGTFKDYWLRVDPKAYSDVGGVKTARAAVASTWRNKDGSLVFKTPEEYRCDIES